MQNAAVQRRRETTEARLLPSEIPLCDLHNPTVLKGLSIWQRQCGTKSMPSRSDLSPRILSGLLRNIALARIIASGAYELRIIGDALVQAQGHSYQGMNTEEIDLIMPGHGTVLAYIYDEVVWRRAPVALRGWYHRKADGRSLFHETVILPLSHDEKTIDHILVFSAYALNIEESAL
jgi:hypothetical protein